MSDPSASLEPFLLVARSTKGAAAAKVIMDATSAPGVYGFGELLDMPNIKQLQSHETLSSHYTLLQLFAYGTFQSYRADPTAYPPLNQAQIEKLKQLSLVSLDQPSVRALEDLIIDSIYAGIISGRMDQMNERFSVDWALGRDLDVGGSGLRDLGMRLENWCEMTENLLSSLDTKIAQARAETIATKAFAEQQKQDRFNSYHAFSSMGTAKSRKGDKQQQPSRPVKEQPSRMSELDAVLSGTSRNTRSHARRTHVSDGIPDSSVPSEAMSRPAEGDGVNSDIDGSANASRVRLHSGATASQASEAVKRVRRGN